VAITAGGSVRDLAPTMSTRVSTATNPASTSGAPQQRHQPPAHITLPVPPSPTVSKHVAHLQHTRVIPLVERVEHIAKVVQPALPPTITHRRFYTRGGRRDCLSAATPGHGLVLAHPLCVSRAQPWCRRRTWQARRAQLKSDGSARVLLACTSLYALIAEVLVDVVNSVLNDIGIDEKSLGSRCSPLSRILQSS